MVATPLPSREAVAIDLALAEVDLSDAPLRDILTVAQHWASGRLVDLAAIDLEGVRATAADVLHCDVSTLEITLILDAAFGGG